MADIQHFFPRLPMVVHQLSENDGTILAATEGEPADAKFFLWFVNVHNASISYSRVNIQQLTRTEVCGSMWSHSATYRPFFEGVRHEKQMSDAVISPVRLILWQVFVRTYDGGSLVLPA